MKNKVIASFLAILFFVANVYSAQLPEKEYYIQQFTDENGLPQNSVKSLAFGEIGFLWIATEGGLVRFDGRRMVVYSKGKLKTRIDRLQEFVRDPDHGTLYAQTLRDHQLITLTQGTTAGDDKFRFLERLNSQSLSPLFDSKNKLLINIDTVQVPSRPPRYAIITGVNRQYYVYADEKIAFIKNGKVTAIIPFRGDGYFEKFPSEPDMRKKVVMLTKKNICADNFISIKNRLFYHSGGEGSDLLEISQSNSSKRQLTGDIVTNKAFATASDKVLIYRNPVHNQAFAYLGKSIYLIDYTEKNGLTTKLVAANFDIDQQLIYNFLYFEQDGILFMGSVSKGLFMVTPKPFMSLRETSIKDFHNVFYAHLPFSKSSVLTPDGLVLGDYQKQAGDGEALRGDPPAGRFTLLKDRDGSVWFKKDHTIYKLEGGSKAPAGSWALESEPNRLYQGAERGITIGGRDGVISQMDGPDADHMTNKVLTKVSGAVMFLYEDAPGRLWIGTEKGLDVWIAAKQKRYAVKGLDGKNIRSVFATRPGQIWITTYGDGIYLIDENKLFKMPLDANGFLNFAHCILKDDAGYFWISSNKGLFRVPMKDLLAYARGEMQHVYYAYFDRNSGFTTNEFNGGCEPCGVKLDDGHFSFPSMNGLVWFKPKEVPTPFLSYRFILEDFRVDGKIRENADTVQLAYNFGSFDINPITPFFGHPSNLKFYYSVNKKGNKGPVEWKTADAGNKVSVYNLFPGVYTVSIRKVAGFGQRFIQREIVLEVASPWFFHWWFVTTIIALILLSAWLYTRWRVLSLSRQNAILNDRVDERTENLSKALDDLRLADEALHKQLQIQIRIIGILNHDLHSPLRYLSLNVPKFFQEIEPSLPDSAAVRYLKAISESIEKVFSLTDNLLKFIKSSYSRTGEVTYEEIPLAEIIHEKASLFAGIALQNETEIIEDVPSDFMITSNRQLIEILIHNLLDNALKHTWKKAVKLSVTQDEEKKVTISVVDQGAGMDKQFIDWLNSASGPSSANGTQSGVPNNVGLGLIIVKEITGLLGIRIRAQSGSEGTSIHLTT